MFKSGILPVLRRSHRVFRGSLGALWLVVLVLLASLSLTSSAVHRSDETQSAATVSGAATGGVATHMVTQLSDRSSTQASESLPVDAASAPQPTQSLPCHPAAMTGTCQGCLMIAPTVVANAPMQVPNADSPFPLLHDARSQLTIAPDARPPKA